MATVPPVLALVDDLVEDILLRFPPDDPAALVRAALVCKGWRRLVSDHGFRRRFHEVHGTAPMLGFIRQRGALFRFKPTTSFHPRFAGERSGTVCRAVDARHGRVLINRYSSSNPAQRIFVVWDPINGDKQVVPRPLLPWCCSWTAAFACAAAGCDHLDCAAGSPFRVVLVETHWLSPSLASVYVYSSEIGAWSDKLITVHHRCPIGSGRTAMVGNALYFWFRHRSGILKYDLDTHMSRVEQTPASIEGQRVLLTATEDGRVGFAMIQKSKLSLWSMGAALDSGGKDAANAGWVQNRVIELTTLLPASALLYPPQLVAFVDSIGVTVLVQTVDGLFAVDLKNSHVREIGKSLKLHSYGVVPFVSFCTPALGAAS